MATLATLQVVFDATVAPLQRGIAQAEQSVKGFVGGVTGSTAAMVGLAGGAVAAGAAVIGAVGASINSFGDFEQTLSGAKAVLGATSDEMEQLKTLALKMGAETAFSAKQAAEGIESLGSAGLNAQQILGGGLNAALQLAAATGVKDLGFAATVTAGAMNSFGLGADQLVRVADAVAKGANISALDVNGFAQSLQAGGAVARQFGISLEEFTAVMGLAANRMITGSDAGTSLKAMLMNAANASAKTQKTMDALGFSLYDAQGRMKSFPAIIANLQSAFGSLTEAERNAAMGQIFGADGIRMATVLMQNGATAFTGMVGQLQQGGAASAAAETRMDNMNGALERMRGSIETAGIALGEKLAPIVIKVAGFVEGLANKVSDFLQSADFQKFAASAKPSLEAVGELLTAVGTALSKAWTGVIQPTLNALKPLFEGVFKGMVDAVRLVTNLLNGDFTGAWNSLKSLVGNVVGGVTQSLQNLGSLVLSAGKGLIDGIVKSVRDNLSRIGIVTGEIVGNILKKLTDGTLAAQMLEIGKNIVSGIVDGIRANLTSIANTVKDMGNAAVQSLKNLLGIKSPSTVFAAIGADMAAGLVVGLEGGRTGVQHAVNRLAVQPTSGRRNAGTSGGASPAGGGLAGGLEWLLAPLQQFGGILQQINPVAALVAGAMEVLQPAIETLIYPLVMVGGILAKAFMPVLKALFPVFKILGLAVLATAIQIGSIWNALASVINAVLGWLGVNLPKIDVEGMKKGWDELINLSWDEAEARKKNTESLEKATAAMTNVPQVWKVAAARWAAADPLALTGGGQARGGDVHVTIVSSDPQSIWARLEPFLARQGYRRRGTPLAGVGGR